MPQPVPGVQAQHRARGRGQLRYYQKPPYGRQASVADVLPLIAKTVERLQPVEPVGHQEELQLQVAH